MITPRILVVDDDANLRKTISDILRIKGYQVVAVGTGAQGIAEATQAFVNVALIDLKLPDVSGIEVMERIKSATPLSEAIILTGHASLGTALEATNKGAFSYLMKPYELDDLLQHIRHAIERQQAQQEILRLSSFPRLSPNPIFEIDAAGDVTYSNPATDRLFPDLVAMKMSHPLLSGLSELFAVIRNGTQPEIVRPVEVGQLTYELRVLYVADSDRILVYVLDITERERYAHRVKNVVSLLSTILAINSKLLIAENEDELFRFACDALKGLEDIPGVAIALKMPDHVLQPVSCAGFDQQTLLSLNIRWDDSEHGKGVMGMATREGRPIVISDVETDPRYLPWADMVRKWRIRSAAAVPLVADHEVMGVLAIYSGQRNAFDEEAVKFLAEVANDIAIGVRSLRLNKKLEATLNSLRKSLYGTVKAVARMVELRDPYTAGHQRRVSQLAYAIGKEMKLPERQLEGLRVTGYLHDIGKIAVPAEILSRPTALSSIEISLIRNHSQSGYEILKDLDFPWPVADTIRQHHERLDGSGYPQGLTGQAIILEARILMVADVVEAIASHRPYRASRGLDAALAEITANRGTLYDPDVVDACRRLFAEHRFVLEDGEQ